MNPWMVGMAKERIYHKDHNQTIYFGLCWNAVIDDTNVVRFISWITIETVHRTYLLELFAFNTPDTRKKFWAELELYTYLQKDMLPANLFLLPLFDILNVAERFWFSSGCVFEHSPFQVSNIKDSMASVRLDLLV